MGSWSLSVFAIAATVFLSLACGKDSRLLRKIPSSFYKSLLEPTVPCEPAYGDYESCENYEPPKVLKKSTKELPDYTSEEENVRRYLDDDVLIGQKRGNGFETPGCNCHLRTDYIDRGQNSFPRYIKNVTCDEHHRCFRARSKEYHCHPIYYRVNVITLRDKEIDRRDFDEEAHLPSELQCCWKSSAIQTVVGCVCGPQN